MGNRKRARRYRPSSRKTERVDNTVYPEDIVVHGSEDTSTTPTLSDKDLQKLVSQMKVIKSLTPR